MQAALSRGLTWPADKGAPGPDLKATCDQNRSTLVTRGDPMGTILEGATKRRAREHVLATQSNREPV